jgi:hypothetical protein
MVQNPALIKEASAVKACLGRMREFATTHTDKEEDILGDEGKELL